MMTPYRWNDPPQRLPIYRAPTLAVDSARRVVAKHEKPAATLTPCPHCFEPDGTRRTWCPLLQEAVRVLMDYGRAPEEWHPADAL